MQKGTGNYERVQGSTRGYVKIQVSTRDYTTVDKSEARKNREISLAYSRIFHFLLVIPFSRPFLKQVALGRTDNRTLLCFDALLAEVVEMMSSTYQGSSSKWWTRMSNSSKFLYYIIHKLLKKERKEKNASPTGQQLINNTSSTVKSTGQFQSSRNRIESKLYTKQVNKTIFPSSDIGKWCRAAWLDSRTYYTSTLCVIRMFTKS